MAARPQLKEIQSRLLDVGSAVATPAETSSQHRRERVTFDAAATSRLEVWIDAMDEELPQLRNFILPSGGQTQEQIGYCRVSARHAAACLLLHALASSSVHGTERVQ